jgi:peptidoglycan/LPS O-acetylase OafA/YrhL
VHGDSLPGGGTVPPYVGEAPKPVRPTGYRPWLDGVRAVAVLMVVLWHTEYLLWLNMGVPGVALFFALSGYLITGLLVDEWSRSAAGRVDLRSFYWKRAARLFPALVLVVAVMDVVLLTLGALKTAVASVLSLVYVANYVAIGRGQFPGAWGHTWSLAVEEHFYLLWPLLLPWLLRRFGLRKSMWATLALCGVALAWRTVLASVGASSLWLEVGSLERADALLYGCAAAMAVRLGWQLPRWTTALAAAVIAAHLAVPGGSLAVMTSATLGVAGAVLVSGLDTTAGRRVRAALSLRPLVRLGVLSYGIYLWHLPLMFVTDELGLPRWPWSLVAAALSVLAAWASYRWVEMPVRLWARRRAGSTGAGPHDPSQHASSEEHGTHATALLPTAGTPADDVPFDREQHLPVAR